MKSQLDLLGRWPVSGPEARKKKQMTLVRKHEGLQLVHGRENHVLVTFFVSNDYLHVGTMDIPANGLSDFEVHKGDEVFCVLDGVVSLLVQDPAPKKRGAQSYSTARHEVREGERFLVPEGCRHQYFNAEARPAKLLFTVAPEL